MVSRHCRCGEDLHEERERLVCRRCGPPAAWVVRIDGQAFGAGSHDELYVSPALLRIKLGISERILEAAARSGFHPAREWTVDRNAD